MVICLQIKKTLTRKKPHQENFKHSFENWTRLASSTGNRAPIHLVKTTKISKKKLGIRTKTGFLTILGFKTMILGHHS